MQDFVDSLKFDEKGLIPAIVQDMRNGRIWMQAFSNKEAVLKTLETGKACFFSRSRNSLWVKGETSGNFIEVLDVYTDCDRDSLIYLSRPTGPVCHTGEDSCFFIASDESRATVLPTLDLLNSIIEERKNSNSEKSWTKKLLENPALLNKKVLEEATELLETRAEGSERTISEMADLLYHSMVFCASMDVNIIDVMDELDRRFGLSGLEEKRQRREQ